MENWTNRQRRRWLARAAGLGASWAVAPLASPVLAAPERIATPSQAMGPFYPLELPLDQDNDLTSVQGRNGRAVGEILDVVGQVLDEKGEPLRAVMLEIWQVNGYGRYHHPDDDQDKPLDPHFQGFGKTLTAEDGTYRFRTVKPITYPRRAPHIHFAISSRSFAKFYTQMYVAGAPENARDFLLSRLRPNAQETLIVALVQAPAGGDGLAARFDIVLGKTVLSRKP